MRARKTAAVRAKVRVAIPGQLTPTLRPDSIFPIASISKPITAAAVMCLVEDGLIGLNRPFVDYVPELAPKRGYRDVTLERLLRMTSGIDFEEESLEGAKMYYATDLRDFLYAYRGRYLLPEAWQEPSLSHPHNVVPSRRADPSLRSTSSLSAQDDSNGRS